LQQRALSDNVADRWQRLHEGLKQQAERVSAEISGGRHRIEVAMDGGTGRFVMKVVDSDSGLVVRQFPPESVLRVRERMDELSGMLLASEA
jgi:flagellar protein FlaG